MPYLLHTYTDKMRFVVAIDFRSGPDFLHLGVKLVDRMGVPAVEANSRVLFALQTNQTTSALPNFPAATRDEATGLVLVYATQYADGWFIVSTGGTALELMDMPYPTSIRGNGQVVNRAFQAEDNVGIAMAVETADSELSWHTEPARQAAFFGLQAGAAYSHSQYAPYARVNLTVHDLCGLFSGGLDGAGRDSSSTLEYFLSNVTNETRTLIAQHAAEPLHVPADPETAAAYTTSSSSTWVEYHDAMLKFAVYGVDPASINTSNPKGQTWLTYPITCLMGGDGPNSIVSWRASSEQDIKISDMLNLSEHFNSTEREALLNGGGGANANTTTAVTMVSILVRVNSTVEGYLVETYMQSHIQWLNGAISEGLRRQGRVASSLHGTQFFPGVDNVALQMIDTEVWVRTDPATSTQDPVDAAGSGCSALSEEATSSRLVAMMCATAVVVMASRI